MGIPNLYDPYFATKEVNGLGDTIGQVYGPADQQRQAFDERVRQLQQLHQMGYQAVMNGADPQETALRVNMTAAGAIPHPAAGLDPSHPTTQAFAGYDPSTNSFGAQPAGPTPQPPGSPPPQQAAPATSPQAPPAGGPPAAGGMSPIQQPAPSAGKQGP